MPQQDVATMHPGLDEALQKLKRIARGKPIAQAIEQHGKMVSFGETKENAIAQFDPLNNQITINHEYHDASPNVLAAHLAHEGTHLQWSEAGSIDQEYHAFKAQAEVWDELKSHEPDAQCDWVSSVMAKGEQEAKTEIRLLYPELPEYWQEPR